MSVTDELLRGFSTTPPPDRQRETLSSVTDEMLGMAQTQRAEKAKKSEAIADPVEALALAHLLKVAYQQTSKTQSRCLRKLGVFQQAATK